MNKNPLKPLDVTISPDRTLTVGGTVIKETFDRDSEFRAFLYNDKIRLVERITQTSVEPEFLLKGSWLGKSDPRKKIVSETSRVESLEEVLDDKLQTFQFPDNIKVAHVFKQKTEETPRYAFAKEICNNDKFDPEAEYIVFDTDNIAEDKNKSIKELAQTDIDTYNAIRNGLVFAYAVHTFLENGNRDTSEQTTYTSDYMKESSEEIEANFKEAVTNT